jgi:16S rRNA (cytosine1402-N4)-methyltransferase
MKSVHEPVMLREAMELLRLKPGDIVLDATTGAGGHAKEMLARITPGGRLIGLDNDADVMRIAEEKLIDL